MIVYWLVALLMVIFQLPTSTSDRSYTIRLILSFLPLFLFGACRLDFGYDYAAYESVFADVSRRMEVDRIEPGYLLLNKIMPSFRWLLIVTSMFTCCAYFYVFKRFVPQQFSWLGMVLLALSGDKTIFFMFSGIRNAISIAILLLSTELIIKRKLKWYIVMMLIAGSFHRSAYIYFPIAYLLTGIKSFGNKEFWVWTICFLLLWLFSNTLIINVVETAIMSYFERYSTYMNNAIELGDNRGILVRIGVLLLFFPLIIFMKRNKLSDEWNTIFKLALFYTISHTLSGLDMRTSHHFIVFFILSTLYICKNSKNNIFKICYTLFVLAFICYAFFIVYLGSPTFPYSEYHSVIQLL